MQAVSAWSERVFIAAKDCSVPFRCALYAAVIVCCRGVASRLLCHCLHYMHAFTIKYLHVTMCLHARLQERCHASALSGLRTLCAAHVKPMM